MGLSNSVPINKNKTYTQEDIKNKMQKIFVNSQNQQNTTYSTLNFDSMKGGSVINDIINYNIDSSSNNYLVGGNYDDSAYDGLKMIKSGIINLQGGKNDTSSVDDSSINDSSNSDSDSNSNSDSDSNSDSKSDNIKTETVNNRHHKNTANSDDDIVSTDKHSNSQDPVSTEGNIFANTKILPFYSSDTSSDYNFQYPRTKNRFDI